jgi:hypothetical protein
MISGMNAFTQIHVLISLIGIFTGIIVVFGLLTGKRLPAWTASFLVSTVLTNVTGFFFPFHGVTPGIIIGIISMVLLPVAIFALYARNLVGAWARTYVITSMIALWFNVFILIVQLFEKVPSLHALAPTQSEPPFKHTQIVVLLLFVVLTIMAATKSRIERLRIA